MDGTYYGHSPARGTFDEQPNLPRESPVLEDFDPLSTPMPSRSQARRAWPASANDDDVEAPSRPSSSSEDEDGAASIRTAMTTQPSAASSTQTLLQSQSQPQGGGGGPSTPPRGTRATSIAEPPLSSTGTPPRRGTFERQRDNVARHGRRDSFRNFDDFGSGGGGHGRRDSTSSWGDSPTAKNPLLPRYSSVMGSNGRSRMASADSTEGRGVRDSLMSSTGSGGYTDDDMTLGRSPRRARPDSAGQSSYLSSGSGSGSSGSNTALVNLTQQQRTQARTDSRLRVESAGAQTLVGPDPGLTGVDDPASPMKSRYSFWSPSKSRSSFFAGGLPKVPARGRPRLEETESDDIEATVAVDHPVSLDDSDPEDDRPGPLALRIEVLTSKLRRRKPVAKMERWINGPVPARRLKIVPFLPRLEAFFSRLFAPISYARHPVLTVLFLIGWLLGMIFLVRASWYLSSTPYGPPRVLGCTDTFWARNDGCGVNGTYCAPFDDNWFAFRCPAQCASVQLLNTRTIGAVGVAYRPLVVGGAQADPPGNGTYRGDSFICQAALHAGLFSDARGGCGVVSQIGNFTDYPTDYRNGIVGTPFPGQFPSAFRFWPVGENGGNGDCGDLRNEILGFNVAMSFVFSFFLRPDPLIFFWVLVCAGFWVCALATDPATQPPVTSTAFGTFLPFLFVCYALWRSAWRYVLPTFGRVAVLERTVWYLGPWWVGVLLNMTLEKLPVQRLTAQDIRQQPGGLVTVIVVAIIAFLLVVQQLFFLRRAGVLLRYLKYYIIGIVSVGLLLAIPGFDFRLHHWFLGVILTPGTAILTRPSAIFQGFLLGMLQNGVARWGFESILQTPQELLGDAAQGSALPLFLTNSTNFATNAAVSSLIQFVPIMANMSKQYDGYSLLVDDVERYVGPSTNYSYAGTGLEVGVPHFFRLAYSKEGVAGDFSKAAVMYLNNMTWYDPEPGPS